MFFLIRCLFENIYVCFLVRTRIFMCFVVSWMFCYAFWGSLKVELCVLPLVEWWVMCFTLVQSCGRLESNVVTWSLMVETNVELWVWWCWNADLWVCCMKLMKLHGLKKIGYHCVTLTGFLKFLYTHFSTLKGRRSVLMCFEGCWRYFHVVWCLKPHNNSFWDLANQNFVILISTQWR